ncbi:hypothetical protein HK22_02065 [Gluconobacter sp. DsW_056]|uniref:hypothetical protein n=1 Tax=Gluconobacter sp. DsW_056 TaxID=1511209 RepID=UPI000A3C7E44|nr:hypothetical protein [Gluconobacter sp. DsW_056]OUI81665.1 hypothetical protein HK22_02065 [Gluconobacter sp. DsW_056]
MAQNGSYQISVGVVDNATKVLKQINSQIRAAQAPTRALQKQFRDFKKLSGFDDVSKSIGRVKISVASVLPGLSAITGIASVGGVMALSKSFADMGIHITQMSNSLGLAGTQIRNLQGAGDLLGIGPDGLTKTRQAAQDLQLKMRAGMLSPEEMNASVMAGINANDSAKTRQDKSLDFLANKKASGASAAQLRVLAQALGIQDSLIGKTHEAVDAEQDRAAALLRTNALGQQSIENATKLYGSFTDVKLATKGVTDAIASALAPAIQPLLQDFASWLSSSDAVNQALAEVKAQGEKFSNWIRSVNWSEVGDRVREWIPSLNTVKLVLEGLVAIKIASFTAGIVSSFMTAGTAIVGLVSSATTLGPALVAIAGPVGIAVAAVAALGAAAYELYEHWDKVGPYFDATWDTIKDGFSSAKKVIEPLANTLSEIMTNMWDGIKSAFDSGWSYVSPVMDKVKAAYNWVAGSKIGKALGWVATKEVDFVKTEISVAKKAVAPVTNDFNSNLSKEKQRFADSAASKQATSAVASNNLTASENTASVSGTQDANAAASNSSITSFSNVQIQHAKDAIASIESQGRYDIRGGSSNRFIGKYQMGKEAISDVARSLHEDMPDLTAFQKNPAMQERYMTQYMKLNDQTLSRISAGYRGMSSEQKIEALGYAHNQGAGAAARWISTGRVGHDAFGTAGTEYASRIQANQNGDRYAYNGTTAPQAVSPVRPVNPQTTNTMLAKNTSNGDSGAQIVVTFENAPTGMKVNTSSNDGLRVLARVVPATTGQLA